MKFQRWLAISAIALSTTFFAAANADEVWQTEIGKVIYADELNEYAVLHFPTMRENVFGIAYIKDLAGNYDNRDQPFEGYWVEPIAGASTACEVGIVDENGDTYQSWGRLKLIFTETAFPSGWVALRGDCFNEPTDALVGKPIVGPIEIQETKFEAK